MVKRRLKANAARLVTLRSDLDVTREQLRSLLDDANDEETRAIVADNTGITRDARRAREQADAMERHLEKLTDEVIERERRQDDLLDQLGAG